MWGCSDTARVVQGFVMAREKKVASEYDNTGYETSGVFFPIPATRSQMVSFATPQECGFSEISHSIKPYKARRKALSDEQTQQSMLLIYDQHIDRKHPQTVKLKKIARAFAPGSYVCLDSLKELNLISADTTYLRIEAAGKLAKPLYVEAHEFDPTAVRMLTLTGGRAVRLL